MIETLRHPQPKIEMSQSLALKVSLTMIIARPTTAKGIHE